jgi:hypothetical protein
MTNYNVHLYREMRIAFGGIEAESPETAATHAAGMPTGDADDIADCEGEDFAALVDVAGDEDFGQSATIDFASERQRKAASQLLAALEAILPYAESEAHSLDKLKDSQEAEAEALRAWRAIADAQAAITAANDAAIAPPPEIDIHVVLAERRQIADVWGILDVQTVRPDLSDEQAWAVLQRARRRYDAATGINWDVLACHADEIAGAAPHSDEA